MKFKNQKHGKTGTKLHQIWLNCRNRCYTENDKRYESYGGRGITMRQDWIDDFLKFEAYVTGLESYDKDDLGKQGLSIDRIDNDGNYEEGNIRWATSEMQGRNRRIHKSNKSGYVGVFYCNSVKKYRARIKVNKKSVYLGIRSTAKEAYQLRVDYILKHKLQGFEIQIPC